MKKIILVLYILLHSCNSPKFFKELKKINSYTHTENFNEKDLFGYQDLKFLHGKFKNSTTLYIYNKGRLISPNGMPTKLTKAIYIDVTTNKYYEITRNLNNEIEVFEENDIDKDIFITELLTNYNSNNCSSLNEIIFRNKSYSLKHNEYFYEINIKDNVFIVCNIQNQENYKLKGN